MMFVETIRREFSYDNRTIGRRVVVVVVVGGLLVGVVLGRWCRQRRQRFVDVRLRRDLVRDGHQCR